MLTPEEEQRFKQAMRNLQGAFGSWSCLAEAMGTQEGTLANMMRGARSVSGVMIVRAMRASGLSLAEMLGGPAPAESLPRVRAGEAEGRMKGMALTLKEIGLVKRAMRPLLTKHQTAELSKTLGCSQQHLSAVLSGAS